MAKERIEFLSPLRRSFSFCHSLQCHIIIAGCRPKRDGHAGCKSCPDVTYGIIYTLSFCFYHFVRKIVTRTKKTPKQIDLNYQNSETWSHTDSDTEILHDIQKRNLMILQDIKRVCNNHKIPFFLAYGTLLGAIRHNDLIPWDDDIDVMMRRDDFEKFLKVADDLGTDYRLQEQSTGSDYWTFHAKVRLLRPKPYVDTLISHITEDNGLFVDIFIFDYLPKYHSIKQMIMQYLMEYTRLILSAKQFGRSSPQSAIRFLSKLAQLVPLSLIRNLMMWGCTFWNNKDHNFLICYAAVINHKTAILPVETFGVPKQHELAGLTMPVPQDSDFFLKSRYGDYMTPPPEDERTPIHNFIRCENDNKS